MQCFSRNIFKVSLGGGDRGAEAVEPRLSGPTGVKLEPSMPSPTVFKLQNVPAIAHSDVNQKKVLETGLAKSLGKCRLQ
ncbi:hypothetical protein M407DRAFT_243282 [Tulasnella calospora MUT 4182]|uniref:Uncharacterized protein n=1 Tax=Tulasnella calospora MUT 4182 TaxID=1051891 RepID=A0A0C3QBA5_9AGAM|nr:hypothetical protein M407DRAFT_243282 [Tulasnella calospora MUT 4182]